MLQKNPGADEKTAVLKKEIMRLYSEISSLREIPRESSEFGKELMC